MAAAGIETQIRIPMAAATIGPPGSTVQRFFLIACGAKMALQSGPADTGDVHRRREQLAGTGHVIHAIHTEPASGGDQEGLAIRTAEHAGATRAAIEFAALLDCSVFHGSGADSSFVQAVGVPDTALCIDAKGPRSMAAMTAESLYTQITATPAWEPLAK